MHHHLTCLLGLLMLATHLRAQVTEHSFTHFGKRDGLVANDATAVTQDDKGFVWIGGMNGLQRYDGARFVTFQNQAGKDQPIPVNHILQLLMDKRNRLWISLAGEKLGIFDTRKYQIREVTVDAHKATLMAGKKLIEDLDGNIFLLNHNGWLYLYNDNLNQFVPADQEFGVPPKWRIRDFYHDPVTRKYWLACDSGLAMYDPTRKLLYSRESKPTGDPVIARYGHLRFLYNLIVDSKRRLWLQSRAPGQPFASIYAVATDNGSPILEDYSLNIQADTRAFCETQNGVVWLYGRGLLAEYVESEKQFHIIPNQMNHERGIIYETVNSLFEDNEHNIWVATNTNGVYHFNPSSIFFQRILNTAKPVNPLVKGPGAVFMWLKDGGFITNSWGNKLLRYDSLVRPVPLAIPGLARHHPIWSMYRMHSGKIMLGAEPGFYIYDENTGKVDYYNPPVFEDGAVNSICEDKEGNLWFGVLKEGLFKWDKNKSGGDYTKCITELRGILPFRITGIVGDRHGAVWVATLGDGMYKFRIHADTALVHISNEGEPDRVLPENSVRGILALNDTTFLVACGGINYFNPDKEVFVRQVTTAHGLPSNNILSMAPDQSNALWMGMYSGLCRMDPATHTFEFFDRLDGIVNDNFSDGAACVMPDGRLIFATANDFIIFDPNKNEARFTSGPLEITGFKTANTVLPLDSLLARDVIRLQSDQNSISIEFTDMSFRTSYHLSYKLEGLDEEWRKADALNQAIYSYLPTGEYEFKVRAMSGDKVIRESIPLRIKVLPPFWRSWWFYGLVFIVLAVLWFWYDRTKIEKRKAIQGMRTQIAGDLHHELNIALSNIYMLSEMARIKADHNALLSKEYIAQIHDKSKNMIEMMDDILWSIKPENDSMSKFLWRTREYTEALSNAHKTDISITIDERVKSLNLNMKLRLEFFLIYKEALHTVVHLGGGSATNINIEMLKGDLCFTLHDDTAVLKETDERIANALRNIEQRAAQLNAKLDIQTMRNGVTMTLLVPSGNYL